MDTHLPTPRSADWSVLVARLLGRGSVVSFHNAILGDGRVRLAAKLYNATFLRVTLRLADRMIVVSDAWRDKLAAAQPATASKLVVIPTGVDLTRFSGVAAGDGTRLLFVGILDRFHRYKGLDVLLDALATVAQHWVLTVVGDGTLRGEYEAQCARLGLSDRVRFVGRIDDDSLRQAYATSDIYILPSDFAEQEAGFTLTALEAMASGLPVVLADGAGQIAKDAAEAGAGLRVAAGDVAGLAEALTRLLSGPDERVEMGVAGRAFVERRHSWDDIAEQRRAVYVEAVDEAQRRRRSRRRPDGLRGPRSL